jgi:hypothetical protein
MKIFEKNIFNRLCHHVNHYYIIIDEQFGFREGSSTELASYNISNMLLALNNKLLVDVFL